MELDLVEELVKIPSHEKEGEEEASEFITEWLEKETEASVTRDSMGNVIARKGGSGGDVSLAFIGHHDVVPPGDSQTTEGRCIVEEKKGRLYGRGTADMKGAVGAMICGFRDSTPRDYELVFASFSSEEQGGLGAIHAIDEGFSPDYAVVGEGSTGYSSQGVTDICVAHKGRREYEVIVEGRAAHASETGKGVNAIYRASDGVREIRNIDSVEAEIYGEKVEGSVAVTEIEGGSARNVIPERCFFTVDERTIPEKESGIEGISELPGVEIEVKQDLPPMVCKDGDFVGFVTQNVNRNQRGEGERVVKPHATDAGHLSDAGVETVVCGPAELGEAHTEDESVDVDVLERCYRIYRDIGENFGEWIDSND